METEKPFLCKEEGCKMRFTNEDHLTVHMKKHAMVLHLSLNNKDSKATSFVADQTPTPTRLIKNCDEVGLFEDLQHVNPFDETFRRAVESKSSASTPTQLIPPDSLAEEETLNTPHVLPYAEYVNSKPNHRKKLRITTKLIKIKNTEDTNAVASNKDTKQTPMIPSTLESAIVLPSVQQITPILSETIKYNKIQPMILTSTEMVQIEVVHSSKINENPGSVLIFPKATPPGDDSTPINMVRARIKAALMKNSLKQQMNNNNNSNGKDDTVDSSANLSTKKLYKSKDPSFSERNKAAAMRYRNKMKAWHKEVEQKNKELIAENEHLKTELAQLRAFMLAHQECSVAKAMAMGHNIPIGLPKLIVKNDSKDGDISQPLYFLVNDTDSNKKQG